MEYRQWETDHTLRNIIGSTIIFFASIAACNSMNEEDMENYKPKMIAPTVDTTPEYDEDPIYWDDDVVEV